MLSTRYYLEKHFYMIAMILVLIGALNWGFIALFQLDLVKKIFPKCMQTIVYILVALSAVYLAIQRDAYLPFLGESVFPANLLNERVPTKFNLQVPVQVDPNSYVVYWASTEPGTNTTSTSTPNWKVAYDQYQNSGIVRANANGLAVLKLNCPQRYTVGLINHTLYKHVHYRVAKDYVWLSRVMTVNVEKQCEGFANANANANINEGFSAITNFDGSGNYHTLDFTAPNLPDTADYAKEDKMPMLDNQPEESENYENKYNHNKKKNPLRDENFLVYSN